VHLLEANHTPEFRNRVRTIYPASPAAKLWLKQFGYELEIDFEAKNYSMIPGW
jgi:predicted metal-dependent hydrolase